MEVEELVVLEFITGYGGCEEDLRLLLLHALLKYSLKILQGDPSEWQKPPVDLDLGCSLILPGQ